MKRACFLSFGHMLNLITLIRKLGVVLYCTVRTYTQLRTSDPPPPDSALARFSKKCNNVRSNSSHGIIIALTAENDFKGIVSRQPLVNFFAGLYIHKFIGAFPLHFSPNSVSVFSSSNLDGYLKRHCTAWRLILTSRQPIGHREEDSLHAAAIISSSDPLVRKS
jgi:hypothetical protein